MAIQSAAGTMEIISEFCPVIGHWHLPPYTVCVLFVDFHSLVAQMVKNPPTVQETQGQSPGQADPLEKEMAIHSSILASRILWTEEPGRL